MSKALLFDCFQAAVSAADPLLRMPDYLTQPFDGHTWVLGAGKAAGRMAEVFESTYLGAYSGLVVSNASHPLKKIELVVGRHPIPDQSSVDAANALLHIARQVQPTDRVIFLLSGGASALIACPPEGVELAQIQAITERMLNGGANIAQLNTVRRCLSRIAGGRLAQACNTTQQITLAISDVTGDLPADIGSGPTVSNPTGVDHVRRLLDEFDISIDSNLDSFLGSPQATPALCVGEFHLIATPEQSLQAAQERAEQQGLHVLNLGGFVEGDANEVAKVMAGIAQQIKAYDRPVSKPALLLSGGETSVRVTGQGRGGRNVQFLMALAQALGQSEGVAAMACDTDGIDGAEEIAGAYVDSTTLSRARHLGYPVERAIGNNDGHGWFEQLNDQVITGPTQTNVNDFRAILIQ